MQAPKLGQTYIIGLLMQHIFIHTNVSNIINGLWPVYSIDLGTVEGSKLWWDQNEITL